MEMNQIGQKIKEAREAAGLTQLSLALAIGYKGDDAGAHICRLEKGDHEPRVRTLNRIAKALGTTVNKLLPSER